MRIPTLRYTLGAIMAVAAIGFSAGAQAWGPQGHAIVADIATLHLTPKALAEVHQLLALEGHHSLDQVSSWPDAIRHDEPQTGPWHFVDIPLSANHYHPLRDCLDGNCVVSRIPDFVRILTDRATSPRQRLRALKFVVHFVGDIHQPLHDENHHDEGGNEVHLRYFDHPTNLHAMWDSRILERALQLHMQPHYRFDHAAVWAASRQLNAGISPAERMRWAPPDMSQHLLLASVHWAEQAHVLARDAAYGDLPRRFTPGWSAAYQVKTWPVVRRQLQRAGVRLAAVLNSSLD